VLDVVAEVRQALTRAGHTVTSVPVLPDLEWFDAIRKSDVVFNLCEGVAGASYMEYKVASAIELTGIPFTGGSAWMMTVCHRKPLLNAVLESAGLSVPRWHLPDHAPVPADFPLPAIVKPAEEDASVGIEQASIVTTLEELEARIAVMREGYGELMVQQYVRGREIAVAIVGEHTLPLSEIDFRQMPDGTWHIVSFDAKWTEASPEFAGTQPVCPANVEPELAQRIVQTAHAAWRAVDGSGYGRVDMRVDGDGVPWVLEVNPGPDISTDAGLANMARAYGWSYDELVSRVVDVALADAVTQEPGRVLVPGDGTQQVA
jgi:D-alanine-D-alanine ligase